MKTDICSKTIAKARKCMAAEEWGKAKKLLDEFKGKDVSFNVLGCMCQLAIESDDHKYADGLIEYFNALIDGNNNSQEHFIEQLVAILYFTKGNNKKACEIIRKALKRVKKNSQDEALFLYDFAMYLFMMKQYKSAEQQMKKVIAYFNEDTQLCAPFMEFMGEIKEKNGKIKEAAFWYQKAIKNDPYESEMYRKCGIMFQNQGNTGKALELWKELLAIKKEDCIKAITDQNNHPAQLRRYKNNVTFAKRQIILIEG